MIFLIFSKCIWGLGAQNTSFGHLANFNTSFGKFSYLFMKPAGKSPPRNRDNTIKLGGLLETLSSVGNPASKT